MGLGRRSRRLVCRRPTTKIRPIPGWRWVVFFCFHTAIQMQKFFQATIKATGYSSYPPAVLSVNFYGVDGSFQAEISPHKSHGNESLLILLYFSSVLIYVGHNTTAVDTTSEY